jgi:AraC-like DNA-binding protein
MQAQYLKLPKQYHQSFSVRKDTLPYFYNSWHYHTEIELVYIIKGTGTRFIGDNISKFSDGDLVLLGTNLPHVWKSDDIYFKSDSKKKVSAIVIHFPIDFLGIDIWNKVEMAAIKKLLDIAKRGITYTVPNNHQVKKQLLKITELPQFERILSLLQILQTLTTIKDFEILSGLSFANRYQENSSERIDKIYDFILNNFNKEIKLAEVAALATMTPASLCRFFKQKTGKSLSEFVNEVRVGFACKLIIESQLSISEVCYQCGFNSLSYFNRQFKKFAKVSPSQYSNKKGGFNTSHSK